MKEDELWFLEEYPDLKTLPVYEWADALRPLNYRTRQRAVSTLPWDSELAKTAQELVAQLLMDELSEPIPEPPPLAPEPAAPASPRPGRQVNLRLSQADYAALSKAAIEFGLRPTQLARQLVVRGVKQLTRP